jgi:hypothetical protein
MKFVFHFFSNKAADFEKMKMFLKFSSFLKRREI